MATLKSQAYSHIRSRIARGTFRGGDKLSPVELGKDLGISHIPVREAISQLESEGFVVQLERQGTFVRELSREEVLDLVDLRAMLERASIGPAVERIGGDEMDALEGYLRQLKGIAERFDNVEGEENEWMLLLGQWMLADLAFHLVLLRAAGNREVVKVISEKQIMLQMFSHRSDSPEIWSDMLANYRKNYDVHEQIFQAAKKRDVKAAREAMTLHNKRTRENLVKRLDWLEEKEAKQKSLSQDFPESMRHFVDSIQHQFMKGFKMNDQ